METNILPKDAYTRTFRMQATGEDSQTVRTSIPRDIIRKEARKLGLSISEFVKSYRVEWIYNDFEFTYIRFVSIDSDKKEQQG